MKKDMVQFAVDLERKDDMDMKSKIEEALTQAGFIDVCAEWKATWTHDDYHNGKKPYESD